MTARVINASVNTANLNELTGNYIGAVDCSSSIARIINTTYKILMNSTVMLVATKSLLVIVNIACVKYTGSLIGKKSAENIKRALVWREAVASVIFTISLIRC